MIKQEKEKKTKEHRNKLVAQSRSLLEGRFNYSVWEYRIFTTMVQSINEDDTEFKKVRLYLKDLANDFESKGKADYKRIREAAINLTSKVYSFDYVKKDTGEERVFYSALFRADVPKRLNDNNDNKYIELMFNDSPQGDLKRMLLDLRKNGNFLLYDKRNIINLMSTYSQRLYPIFKAHEKKNADIVYVRYSIGKLRDMLLVDNFGRPTNKYKKHFLFKKRVILKAQEDLKKHTDIEFDFTEEKKGKKVIALNFRIFKNRKKKPKNDLFNQPKEEAPPTTEAPQLDDSINSDANYQQLIDIGVSYKKAYSIIQEHDSKYLADTLKICYKEFKQNTTIRNKPAYTIKAIEDGYHQQAIDQEKEKARKKADQAQKKAERAEKAKQSKLLHDQFLQEYEQARTEAINNYLSGWSDKEIAEEVEKLRHNNIFINRQLANAERQGDKEKIKSIQYGLFARVLPKEHLHSFPDYLRVQYGLKPETADNGERIVVEL